MDPNTTLAELREMVEEIMTGSDAFSADDLAEKFDALDTWLSSDGFLPLAWGFRHIVPTA